MMGKSRPEAEGLDVFTKLLLESTLERSLDGLSEQALLKFAHSAFDHVIKKPHKRHAIAYRQTDLTSKAGAELTVLEILNDDMPYVVESVIAELHSQGLIPRLVFHPIFKVKRYGSGRLQAVVGPGDRHWGSGDQESYFAAVLPAIDGTRQAALTAALDLVLDDLRHTAGDGDVMRRRLLQLASAYDAIQLGVTPPPGAPGALEVREAGDFLRWLTPANFTLMGLRDYDLVGMDSSSELWPSAAGALGLARRPEGPAGSTGDGDSRMNAGIQSLYGAPQPLIFSKTRQLSTIRGRRPLDRIGIKKYTPAGKLIGETRLYGQFTPASYLQPVESVPLLRLKVRQVLAAAQYPPDSHNGRTLIDILENFPRDELLQIETALLSEWSRALLDLDLRPRTSLLLRRDAIGRSTSALVFVPRDHYSSDVRTRIGRLIEEQTGGTVSAFYPYISASPLVRTQFLIADGVNPPPPIDTDALSRRIADIVTTWDERLVDAIAGRTGATSSTGQSLAATAFRGAFPAGYMETFPVERAVQDIARIERLAEDRPAAIDFYRDPQSPAHRFRAAIYRFDNPVPLSERVPILENMGFRVIDERSYRIRPVIAGRARPIVLHDMVLETTSGAAIDLAGTDARMEEAFMAVFSGEAESDLFNALIVAAGLDWREAAVIRAFAAYLRQIRAPFGPRYIAETLLAYPTIAADLNALFAARHRLEPAPHSASPETIRAQIEATLAKVTGLDEDRILRRLLSVVLAIVRCNVFTTDASGTKEASGKRPAVFAFKLASREIDRLPEPRPYREIFVYSPRVEGIHLRFAAIARGGIRWSDRAQDYRTEVLGLAKAQQVKNTVIVPTGAKGGFVPKQISRTASREEVQAEGVACYRLFIEALLSLTDDIRGGAIVPSPGIIRHDGDDPYLVVAADKGTATFSDHANAISLARGFWLGDAFASGGSTGYDHKRMGITARGAWECVKRHFHELNLDIHAMPFSVVGVGDMSGDVFGNAMLLSDKIRLIAAFDHRDIFIDPAPDPAASFAERQRLFQLPRSSWADYDARLISQGGGVFSRNAKSIPLSPQAKARLGLAVDALPPSDLIQAILRCQTDLLWFGGIGTYVRETNETDDQAGDRANDANRITAAELRARVVGEGANLGVTQRGRIEAAQRGVRIDTDFIDNSAGVNTSDQEVNIKIALQPARAAGQLTLEDRNRLLAAMATDVAASVLANNDAQALALSLAERASRRDIGPFARTIRHIEERGLIDRKLEALPPGAQLTQRGASGEGLTRPELAVVLSWSKIALNADLLASRLPDEPGARETLLDYFPLRLRQTHAAAIIEHPLRREIVATTYTNRIVNRGGPELMAHLAAETGESPEEIAGAFLAAETIQDADTLWREIGALDGKVTADLQLELYENVQGLVARETRRLLDRRTDPAPFQTVVAERTAAVRGLSSRIGDLLPQSRAQRRTADANRLALAGVPVALAERMASLAPLEQALELAPRAAIAGTNLPQTARIVFATADYMRMDELVSRAAALQSNDVFDQRAIAAAIASLRLSETSLVERALRAPPAATANFTAWAEADLPALALAHAVTNDVLSEPGFAISRLAYAAECVRLALASGA